ncbi:MAG: hypothetical protein GY820_48615 [Gammaproteobacteria bacterium]|nr:hypothetical protein [Gammaproteobacteria bacterium]
MTTGRSNAEADTEEAAAPTTRSADEAARPADRSPPASPLHRRRARRGLAARQRTRDAIAARRHGAAGKGRGRHDACGWRGCST